MSVLPPIPPELLGDTATVYAPDTSSEFEHQELPAETWAGVRLDGDAQAVDTDWAHDKGLSAVLYIDATLSDPPRPPAMRSRVVVERQGRTYEGRVRDIRELCDYLGMVHHWEVGLA